MTLLRFDPAGAIDESFGITTTQYAACLESLERLPVEFSDPATSRSYGDLRSPDRLLTEYEATREESELGRVFRVANRLHDHIDAVAVIGDGDILLGPISLMRACCEPYHNELSRSGRGSKSRVYFAAADYDNDAADGLLRRLSAGGSGPHAAEQRYAVIAIDALDADISKSIATATSMRLVADQLTSSLGDGARRWLRKLLIPITPAVGPVRCLADSYQCDRHFQSDGPLAGPLGIYSPACMLPAAMLGLDCIQFLVGAAVMNEHFFAANFPDNMVLQFVAVQLAMREFRGLESSRLQAWNPALDGFRSWWDRWMHVSANGGEWPVGNGIIHHLCVDTMRTDHLRVDRVETGNEHVVSSSSASYRGKPSDAPKLPELMAARIATAMMAERATGQPSTKLTLPSIDSHALGQLFQFTWLARSCLESIDPYEVTVS